MSNGEDWTFELHMTFVNLCAEEKITHEEHESFEDVLEAVMERSGD